MVFPIKPKMNIYVHPFYLSRNSITSKNTYIIIYGMWQLN